MLYKRFSVKVKLRKLMIQLLIKFRSGLRSPCLQAAVFSTNRQSNPIKSFFFAALATATLTIIPAQSSRSDDTGSSNNPGGPQHQAIKSTKYMGVASCASSNCHGHAKAVQGQKVLLNEYLTWYRHDSHSKAYKILLNAQSKKIASNLGIAAPEKSAECLACHSTSVSDQSFVDDKFRAADGVGCEACHGAAGDWLKSHTRNDQNHQDNLNNGMRDLRNTENKTKLCLSCHLGNDDQHVNHRIMGAGHPRLKFEQDTYEAVMPRHWIINGSNNESTYNPVQTWLISLNIQAAERLKILYSKSRSHMGILPEFTSMTCYSCHHSLSQNQYASRNYSSKDGKPRSGEIVLNVSELTVLAKAIEVFKPDLAANLDAKLNSISKDFGRMDISDRARDLVQLLENSVAPALENLQPTSAHNSALINAISSISMGNMPYETAEQIAMAVGVLSSSGTKSKKLEQMKNHMFNSLKSVDGFNPNLFRIK